MKFKVGERVVVYAGGNRYMGEVTGHASYDKKYYVIYNGGAGEVHEKQMRRIKNPKVKVKRSLLRNLQKEVDEFDKVFLFGMPPNTPKLTVSNPLVDICRELIKEAHL